MDPPEFLDLTVKYEAMSYNVKVDYDATVLEFQRLVEEECKVEVSQQVLRFQENVLEGDKRLEDYELDSGDVITVAAKFWLQIEATDGLSVYKLLVHEFMTVGDVKEEMLKHGVDMEGKSLVQVKRGIERELDDDTPLSVIEIITESYIKIED